jgi:isochorismate pyruvate lyase
MPVSRFCTVPILPSERETTLTPPLTPQDCANLDDIRTGIDWHDRQIFDALVQRLQYVKAAAQFKPSEESIPAPERVTAMLEQRLEWAAAAGFEPAFTEALFERIIHWNIQQQIAHWRATRTPHDAARAAATGDCSAVSSPCNSGASRVRR